MGGQQGTGKMGMMHKSVCKRNAAVLL
jgi:hypothetical protein